MVAGRSFPILFCLIVFNLRTCSPFTKKILLISLYSGNCLYNFSSTSVKTSLFYGDCGY